MPSNRDVLVANLQTLPLFAGRYRNLQCVNYNPATGEKRGSFSLVFSAIDTSENRKVAIKFFDVDVNVLQDAYRIQAFAREPGILQALLGKERCLQLVAALATYQLDIIDANGTLIVSLPCKYFVVEWIDQTIDDFFDRQDQYAPAEKLKLFNEIVLGVEALHRHEVHHRDLKPDNLRSYIDALNRIVVAIDLGTAARLTSPALLNDYQAPVGAIQYSAPEAFCGMSGDRKIGPATDAYALGCLLYELFNKELYVYEVRRALSYTTILAAMALDLVGKRAPERLDCWRRNVRRFSKSIPTVSIDGPGTSVPPSLRALLNDLVASLTRFDFEKRLLDLERVRRYIWSALRILQHDAAHQARIAERARMRQLKVDKTRRKQERLDAFLIDQGKLKC